MRALLELLALLRLGGCLLSARQYEADIGRAKRGLARSLAAADEARAELALYEHERTAPRPVPTWLYRTQKGQK